MKNNKSNISEINYILDEMKNNISIRNTLLTFCFTSVITTIGFGINNFDEIPFILFIIPMIITLTFSCRITYYKDKQCRMNAYLNVFHKNSLQYELIYKEKCNIADFCMQNKFTSFIINNELLLLSIVCMIIYFIKI